MKKLFGAALFAVILAPMGLMAEEYSTTYYPLKVGNKWTYKIGYVQLEVRVQKKEKVGKEDAYKLVTTLRGKEAATEHLVVRGDGVYRLTINGVKIDPPVLILPIPAFKEKKWDIKSKVGAEGIEGTFTIHDADVKVPAGSFKTRVTDGPKFKVAGVDTTWRIYFAEDVGVVKLELTRSGSEDVMELEKFEPAADK